jgi:signal transduction histidine kinase
MIAWTMRPKAMPLSTDAAALKEARKRANKRIAFLGHAVIYAATSLFLFVVAGLFPALVVSLSWGIGLAAHGFFGVVAPELRDRWIAEEVSHRVESSVGRERRSLGVEHAKEMHRLSAAVAHEIRNPITAAKSLVQQMGEDPGSEENVEYAKIAIEELDRVEKSISHLLRYAREEALRTAPMRLNPVVESALETLRDRLDGVAVSRDLVERDEIVGDADALRRVVINLVNNALDAIEESHPSEPAIVVSTGRSLSGEMLWLSVRDNGCGIEPERVGDVFSPFHTSKDQGTGLGLAITKKLVEGHGGTIEVNPSGAPESGTEIVVTLPRGGKTSP